MAFDIDRLNLLNRLINHLGGKLGLVDAGAHGSGSGSAYDADLLALDLFRQFLLVRLYIRSEHTDRTEGHAVRDEFI